MNLVKTSRLAAAIALAASLAACNAGGNGSASNNNGGGSANVSETCASLQPGGAIDTVRLGLLCELLDGTPATAVNDLVASLIVGTPLEDLVNQLNDLIGPNGNLAPVNELLQMLIGGNEDGALTPVIQGLNAVLIALLVNQDPAAIAEALQNIAGGAGGGGTGTPLDALLALGGGDNPLSTLLGALTGGGSGGGTSGGLISNVQNVLNNLTNDTPLDAVAGLVDTLLNPQNGALEPLTSALEELTEIQGGPLAPLTELVGALLTQDDAALAPVILALNEILVGLLTNQDPTVIASALQNLAGNLTDSLGGDNPLSGLLPGGGSGDGGSEAGLISSVQNLTTNLLGDTILDPVQSLVDTLVDPTNGALAPLTGVLEQITTSPKALGQVTALVNGLIAADDAALAPVIEALQGVLSLGGALGGDGGGSTPGVDDLNSIPIIGPILGGLLGGLI